MNSKITPGLVAAVLVLLVYVGFYFFNPDGIA